MSELVVFLRPGCHLCADVLAHLERLRPELGFTVRTQDIEADDELHRRYLERIPVIALDGEELSDFFVDEDLLRARLGSPGR